MLQIEAMCRSETLTSVVYHGRDAQKPQGPGEPALPEESELGFAPPVQPQEDAR